MYLDPSVITIGIVLIFLLGAYVGALITGAYVARTLDKIIAKRKQDHIESLYGRDTDA